MLFKKAAITIRIAQKIPKTSMNINVSIPGATV